MALFDVISTAQVNNFEEYEQHVVLSLAINNTNKMQSSWGSVVTDESVELSWVKKQKKNKSHILIYCYCDQSCKESDCNQSLS